MTYHPITQPGTRPINEDSAATLEQDGRLCFVVVGGLGNRFGGLP